MHPFYQTKFLQSDFKMAGTMVSREKTPEDRYRAHLRERFMFDKYHRDREKEQQQSEKKVLQLSAIKELV